MSRATRPSRGVWDESEVREQEVVRRKVGHDTRLGPVCLAELIALGIPIWALWFQTSTGA